MILLEYGTIENRSTYQISSLILGDNDSLHLPIMWIHSYGMTLIL